MSDATSSALVTVEGVGGTSDPTESGNWRREIELALPIVPQLILTGSIRDLHLGGNVPSSTLGTLRETLIARGFDLILLYDLVDGLQLAFESESDLARRATGYELTGGSAKIGPHELTQLLRTVIPTAAMSTDARANLPRTAVLIDYASRMRDPEIAAPDEVHELLTTALKLAGEAEPLYRAATVPALLYNQVIWVVDRQQDLPHWLTAADGVRTVSIPFPTLETRTVAAEHLASALPGFVGLADDGQGAAISDFARSADGMSIRSMLQVVQLARAEAIPAASIADAVRLFRVGLQQSPWRAPGLRPRIAGARETLGEAVKGQTHAIEKVRSTLANAYQGLSGGLFGDSHPHRPQGVMIFAGPTGVGKTELVKAIARLIFGSADSMIRFDMSEYSAEHSEARLIGAPPGYTGHNAGGELTNAVRENPFCILLFDEMEKAHPSILKKFLQIIEDGRLTDGSGSTVQFSETLIFFTTNLGVTTSDGRGGHRSVVAHTDDPAQVQTAVRAEIVRHFTSVINQQELLNRIGLQNIVVFDYIRPEVVPEIVDKFLGNLVRRVQERAGVTLGITTDARQQLIESAFDRLHFGGRGIGASIDEHLAEPLAGELFERDAPGAVTVTGLVNRDGVHGVELA